MASRTEFVRSIYDAALAAGLTDPAARVMASQAALESAYGEKAPGNNLFGVKAGKSWKGKTQTLTTHEIVNGKRVKIKDAFRAYDTPEEAIADRVAFMETRFPEFNQAATSGDALDALQNGKYGKYYTADPAEYEGTINYINSNFLDGTPVPPASIRGASGARALAGAAGRPAAPTPFPTRRMDFNSLPAPAPLRAQVQQAALGNNAGTPLSTLPPPNLPLNPSMPPRPSSWEQPGQAVSGSATANGSAALGGTKKKSGSLGASGMALGNSVSGSASLGGGGLKATPVAAAAAPVVTTKTVANPAYAEWAKKYGTVTAPTMQETRDEQALMRGAAKPKATVPPAPPKTIKVTQAAAPAPTGGGGFDLGGMFKQGTDFLGQKANEVGNALGNTANQVQTGLAKTGQAVGDVLQSEAMKSVGVRTAFIDPIIAKAFTNKSYGATENAAAARQAVPDGFVRGASGKKLYKIGQTYQSSKGMVVATADGFRPAGSQTSAAAYAPPAKVNPAIAATASVVKKPAAKPASTGALGLSKAGQDLRNNMSWAF